ncbi:MAG: DUF6352 family protein [Alphaproteobacteria bacterium]|nr:DUF6352 family protein [Alphaproteobacteria bacterium]
MHDFWLTSGYHLLTRDADGNLEVGDELLRAYLVRPELDPVEESCEAERALHAALMENPHLAVDETRLRDLADPDVAGNYRIMLRFRDDLVGAGTIERSYLSIFERGAIDTPPLFLEQLTHMMLRGILDGIDDPIRARAAELLFREQRVTIQGGAVMVADAEIVDRHQQPDDEPIRLTRLLAEGEAAVAQVELDVLSADNAEAYWSRSDHFDTVLDLSFAGAGLDALCRVMEAWVAHMLGVDVAIQPVQQITDERWVWHIGLDTEATAILNELYEGREVGEDRLARLVALFRLEAKDPSLMRADIAGRPIYLGLAMTQDGLLRMKPQNLLLNMPLADKS